MIGLGIVGVSTKTNKQKVIRKRRTRYPKIVSYYCLINSVGVNYHIIKLQNGKVSLAWDRHNILHTLIISHATKLASNCVGLPQYPPYINYFTKHKASQSHGTATFIDTPIHLFHKPKSRKLLPYMPQQTVSSFLN